MAASTAPRRDARIERVLVVVLATGVGIAFALACTAAFTMSLAADEAWILSGAQGLVERGEYGNRYGPGATTSGGVHVAAEYLLFWLAGATPGVLRLFPLACFALLLASIFGWSRRGRQSRTAALLAVSVPLSLPGTLILAGSGFAALPATLLALVGIALWEPLGQGSFRRRCGAAALLGLAAATRLQCALVFPAVALGSLSRAALRRRRFVEPVLALALGVAVLALCYALLIATVGSRSDEAMFRTGHGAGLDRETSVGFVLKKWISANAFLPLPLLAGSSVVAGWLGRSGFPSPTQLRSLVWFGWLSWLGWIAFAPIHHLRYLWPGLAAFACVLGFGLGALHDRAGAGSAAVRRGALLIGIACVLAGCGAAVRHLVLGDLNIVTWEWREKIGRRPFHQGDSIDRRGDEARMVSTIGRLPPTERIGTLGNAVEIEFLAGRALIPLRWYGTRFPRGNRPFPEWLLVTPHVGHRLFLRPEGQLWLRDNTVLEARFGGYALHRVVGPPPADVGILVPSPRPIE